MNFGQDWVSNSEMEIFLQDQENQGILRRRTAVRLRKIPPRGGTQIDAEIAASGSERKRPFMDGN